MKVSDFRMKSEEREILRSLLGKVFLSVLSDETGSSAEVAGMSVGDNTVYLYSFTEPIDYYGSVEDVALWTLERVKYPVVDKKRFITQPVEAEVKKILVVHEHQQVFENGEQLYNVRLTRGIIFDFGDYQLSLEKAVWFSEEIYINRGYDLIDKFQPVSAFTDSDGWRDGLEARCEREIEIME